jgi:alpha-beta hydrolase superfamily lysophospholipase
MNFRNALASLVFGGITMISSTLHAARYQESDATITVHGVEIQCRLTLPSRTARGAVLLIPGSLYSDVDGNYPSMNVKPHAYADLAQQLGTRGFAVLRMAKIGPGTGSRTIDPVAAKRHVEFTTRVEVAAAGLAWLRKSVPAGPMIVAGHSEGAVVGSLLAAGPAAADIDGVVSLSGPALPILDILRTQVVAMAPPGVTPDMTIFDRTITAIRKGDRVPSEAKTDPHTAMLASMPDLALSYLRSVDEVDPASALGKVRKPVLIVQGERDDSVSPRNANLLHAARAGMPTELVAFPNLTHFYKVAPKNLTPMQLMELDGESDPAVADAIEKWVAGLN